MIGIGIGTFFFVKNMLSGVIFHDILRSQGYFFDRFLCFLWSLDVFGVLEGPWGRHWRNTPLHGSPFGSISAPFFDENRVFFHVFF